MERELQAPQPMMQRRKRTMRGNVTLGAKYFVSPMLNAPQVDPISWSGNLVNGGHCSQSSKAQSATSSGAPAPVLQGPAASRRGQSIE